MNLLCIWYSKKSRLSAVFADILFKLIQKPLLCMDRQNSIQIKGKLRNCKVMISGNGNSILIEEGALLNKVFIEISGSNNKLIIRRNARFAEGGRIRIEDFGNTIELDENATMINCFLSSADKNTRMYIGRNCLFSADVIIRTSDAHSILRCGTNERINAGKDVIIGEHVWICNGARVMKGTVIGDNCVIGSNTLVSGQQVDDNCLAVGNPCNVVKKNINWSNIRC